MRSTNNEEPPAMHSHRLLLITDSVSFSMNPIGTSFTGPSRRNKLRRDGVTLRY